MAQTKRKKPSTTTKSNSKARAPQARKNEKPPYRREVMAAVCFLLAIYTFIGYRNLDGAFIGLFCNLVKGLVGHGLFALAPALMVCALILTFHRGRPVRFRILCTLLLVVVTGSLAHLFAFYERGQYDRSFGIISEIWRNGTQLLSGGVIGGILSEVFTWLFSKTGAAILFICTALFLTMSLFRLTIAGIVDAFRARERREYIPEPEPEYKPTPAHSTMAPSQRYTDPQKRKRDIDIPIDGEISGQNDSTMEKSPKTGLFRGKPRVKTPDEHLTGYSPDSKRAENEGSDPDKHEKPNREEIEDLPLDIPFMESRRRGTAPEITPAVKTPPAVVLSENDNKGKSKAGSSEQIEPIKTNPATDYVFPPIDLLTEGKPNAHSHDEEEVRTNSERLESAFHSFGVDVTISNTTRGPAVTRYEAELEPGVKLSRLTSLADDIAMSLGVSVVRIAAMPNKISTVGIEVPNKKISTVNLRNIIESKAFQNAKSNLTFAVGMDISGEAIVGNVSKLPHMLVAGTTGSGKSVCLNSLILSILYKATPEDVRFIMIDPKMVEFKVYNNIPHLLVPVVTDIKKAAGALQWAVVEMMKRYALFSETNARDISGYNQIARGSEEHVVLPQIIVVIDELADLMMMAAKEVEESVCRIAQMGRAAGIHLIIATQSPRADVITGLMKANIPSRIALKVSSALESRIILDAGGNADKLVGVGDMLYAPIGAAKPMRIQGTWVSDNELEKVVEFIKKGSQTKYSEEVMGEIEKAATAKSSGDKSKDEQAEDDYDELLPQAVDVIFETGQASVSMLQRRLKLGYSRAARIVDQMESLGIVGPFEGSKPRAVLVTKEQWRQMQYISGHAPRDRSFFDGVISVSEDSGNYDDDDPDDMDEQEDSNDSRGGVSMF